MGNCAKVTNTQAPKKLARSQANLGPPKNWGQSAVGVEVEHDGFWRFKIPEGRCESVKDAIEGLVQTPETNRKSVNLVATDAKSKINPKYPVLAFTIDDPAVEIISGPVDTLPEIICVLGFLYEFKIGFRGTYPSFAAVEDGLNQTLEEAKKYCPNEEEWNGEWKFKLNDKFNSLVEISKGNKGEQCELDDLIFSVSMEGDDVPEMGFPEFDFQNNWEPDCDEVGFWEERRHMLHNLRNYWPAHAFMWTIAYVFTEKVQAGSLSLIWTGLTGSTSSTITSSSTIDLYGHSYDLGRLQTLLERFPKGALRVIIRKHLSDGYSPSLTVKAPYGSVMKNYYGVMPRFGLTAHIIATYCVGGAFDINQTCIREAAVGLLILAKLVAHINGDTKKGDTKIQKKLRKEYYELIWNNFRDSKQGFPVKGSSRYFSGVWEEGTLLRGACSGFYNEPIYCERTPGCEYEKNNKCVPGCSGKKNPNDCKDPCQWKGEKCVDPPLNLTLSDKLTKWSEALIDMLKTNFKEIQPKSKNTDEIENEEIQDKEEQKLRSSKEGDKSVVSDRMARRTRFLQELQNHVGDRGVYMLSPTDPAPREFLRDENLLRVKNTDSATPTREDSKDEDFFAETNISRKCLVEERMGLDSTVDYYSIFEDAKKSNKNLSDDMLWFVNRLSQLSIGRTALSPLIEDSKKALLFKKNKIY